MILNSIPTQIEEIGYYEFQPFIDDRGSFSKDYEAESFAEIGVTEPLAETYISVSKKGVIRGMHFQAPHYQTKICRVVKGAVLDILVDVRKTSGTFGKWESFELSESNNRILIAPAGFAHGFQALEEGTIFSYKGIGKYFKEEDTGINALDPALALPWPIPAHIISQKDSALPSLLAERGNPQRACPLPETSTASAQDLPSYDTARACPLPEYSGTSPSSHPAFSEGKSQDPEKI